MSVLGNEDESFEVISTNMSLTKEKDSGILKKEQRIILLVGRCGNGKSSIGNSILGERYFTTGTQEYSLEPVFREKDDLKVIVCPFIGDTGDDISYKIEDIHEATRNMLETHLDISFSSGIEAIVLALKYGVRFTKQEKDASKRVKEIFGQNVFRDIGIIAFSYGDLFNLDNSNQITEFDEWCDQQTGDVKELFEECQNRCVLFNNKEISEEKLKIQSKNLWECVEKSNFQNKKTNEKINAQENRKEKTTEENCTEENRIEKTTMEICIEENRKEKTTGENCTEENRKEKTIEEICTEENRKEKTTGENCTEENRKEKTTEEICTEKNRKEKTTGEICTEENRKEKSAGEICTEENRKDKTTEEICTEENRKEKSTGEICTEENRKEKSTGEICTEENRKEKSTGEICTEENRKEKSTGEICTEENRIEFCVNDNTKENTVMGNSNFIEGNTESENTTHGNIKEVENIGTNNKNINSAAFKITRKYTIRDYYNSELVFQKDNNITNDSKPRNPSFLSSLFKFKS